MVEESKPTAFVIPYRNTPFVQPEAFPGLQTVGFPFVKLTLRHNGHKLNCNTLIDSGCHSCLFPHSMGEQLGLNVENGKRAYLYEGDIAYFWEINVTLEDQLDFPLYAGFSKQQDKIKLGLLGHLGFFDKFDVRFELNDENVILIPKSSLVIFHPP